MGTFILKLHSEVRWNLRPPELFSLELFSLDPTGGSRLGRYLTCSFLIGQEMNSSEWCLLEQTFSCTGVRYITLAPKCTGTLESVKAVSRFTIGDVTIHKKVEFRSS